MAYGAVKSNSDVVVVTKGVEETSLIRRIFPNGYFFEIKQLLSLAVPTILTVFCQFLPQSVSIIMCGHLSKKELDAAALANSIINIAGIVIGLGLTTACDTYFSQTYGSTNKKRMGIYLQRSLLILNVCLLPILVIHLNIEQILLLLQQDPEISKMAAEYIIIFLPGLFFDFNFLTLSRYLQNQNRVYPPLICAITGNIFNVISQYVAIYVFNFSYQASALCQMLSIGVMLLTIIIYIAVSKVYKETWNGLSKEALYDWGAFMKLALPGVLQSAMGEWSFEVGTFLAGAISDVQLGAQGVLFQLGTWTFMIPMGLGVAVNIRVGQQIGSWSPLGAITSYRVALTAILFTSAVIMTVIISMRNIIPAIFSNDQEVIDVAADVLPVMAFYTLVDSIMCVSNGVLRGCGRQIIGACTTVIGYYIIGLPIGIPLTLLTDIGIKGMWIGLLVGVASEAFLLTIAVTCQDWHKQCSIAQERAAGGVYVAAEAEKSALFPEDTEGLLLSPSETEDSQADLTSGEKEALLSDGRHRKRHSRRYSGRFSDVFEPPVDVTPKPTSTFKPVLIKRICTVTFLLMILLIGVLLRIFLPAKPLCIPDNFNSTGVTLPDLPFCNTTVI